MSDEIAHQRYTKKTNKVGCFSIKKNQAVKKNVCSIGFQQGKINVKAKLKHLTGFTIGPKSHTFEALIEQGQIDGDDLEEWRYASVYGKKQITYDFSF